MFGETVPQVWILGLQHVFSRKRQVQFLVAVRLDQQEEKKEATPAVMMSHSAVEKKIFRGPTVIHLWKLLAERPEAQNQTCNLFAVSHSANCCLTVCCTSDLVVFLYLDAFHSFIYNLFPLLYSLFLNCF